MHSQFIKLFLEQFPGNWRWPVKFSLGQQNLTKSSQNSFLFRRSTTYLECCFFGNFLCGCIILAGPFSYSKDKKKCTKSCTY